MNGARKRLVLRYIFHSMQNDWSKAGLLRATKMGAFSLLFASTIRRPFAMRPAHSRFTSVNRLVEFFLFHPISVDDLNRAGRCSSAWARCAVPAGHLPFRSRRCDVVIALFGVVMKLTVLPCGDGRQLRPMKVAVYDRAAQIKFDFCGLRDLRGDIVRSLDRFARYGVHAGSGQPVALHLLAKAVQPNAEILIDLVKQQGTPLIGAGISQIVPAVVFGREDSQADASP